MGSNVDHAEGRLRSAEIRLASAKDAKKQAQKSNNYKNACNSTKTFVDGKSLNSYDYNIYMAQKEVAKCKAQLSEAKKEAKKKK